MLLEIFTLAFLSKGFTADIFIFSKNSEVQIFVPVAVGCNGLDSQEEFTAPHWCRDRSGCVMSLSLERCQRRTLAA